MTNESRSNSTADTPTIVGQSPAMREVLQTVRRAAQSDASVVLLGESGTGKQLLAATLHRLSKRQGGPFIRVDCAALRESVLEQELLGDLNEPSRASADRTSKIIQAQSGTLFLNDLHAISPAIQVQLLRVITERTLNRIAGGPPVGIDVRFISASDIDLYGEVAAGRFRADLFWRLNVVPIHMPPLRRRREDIAPLADHFLAEYGRASGRPTLRVNSESLAALQQYGWPGNVRELQNYMERAVVLAEGNELTPDLLPGAVRGQQKSEMSAFRGADPTSLIVEIVQSGISTANGGTGDLHARIVNPVERELIVQVMELCNHVQKKAADRLGMNRNTLHKKLKEYGIE